MRGAAARIGTTSLRASVALFAPALIATLLIVLVRVVYVLALMDWGLTWGFLSLSLRWPVSPFAIAVFLPAVAGAFGVASAWRLHRDRFRLELALPRFVLRTTIRLTALLAALSLAAAGGMLLLGPGLTESARSSAAAGDCGPIVELHSLGVPSARSTARDWLEDDDPSYRFLGAALVLSRDADDDRARRVLVEAIEPLRARFPTPESQKQFGPVSRGDLWRYNAGESVLVELGWLPARMPEGTLVPWPGILQTPRAILGYWDGVADRLRPRGP